MASSKVKSAQEGPRLDSYRYAVTPEDVGSKKQKKVDMHELKQDLSMEEHKIDIPSLFSRLNTDPKSGLMPEQALANLQRDGPNEVTPPFITPLWLKFAKQLFGGFSLLMWIGALLSFIAYAIECSMIENAPGDNLYLAIVLTAVVLVTGCFSFYVEHSGACVMDEFREQMPQYATVRRNGRRMMVKTTELVVGDIIDVKCGDRIPADIRLLKTQDFKVDNFSLTGVTDPCVRTAEFTHENPLETKNLAFFSTNAVEGSCRGVVINTGDRTVMGKIANLSTGVEVGHTSLAIEIAHIIHIFSGLAVYMAIFFFIMAFILSYFWLEAIILLIGVILANVPVGLLPIVTMCLILTAQRMYRKNCLIKSYNVVETLGATSYICADKTGVITQNRMTAAHMWLNGRVVEVDTSEDQASASYRSDPSWLALARCAMLCNKARFKPGQEGVPVLKRECDGNATESALLKLAELAIGNVSHFRKRNEEIVGIPFRSSQKYQVSIHNTEDPNDPRCLLVMKGAPETILDKCYTYMKDGKEYQINDQFRAAFNLAYLELGGLGERVLGFCDYVLPADQYPPGYRFATDKPNFPLTGLRFIGLVSLLDPPRIAVPEAIRKCRSAQIKVIMVTGDHPITAKAVAKQVGIISENSKTVEDIALERGIAPEDVDPRDARACVIHGNDLDEMTTFQIDEIMNNHPEIVFARTSPEQKIFIVEGCQRQGGVVAVTGDGVNDSNALKKADIGIAMGSGSDMGKHVANMILLDDNFASIISGIEEGRLVYENLKKSIMYTMTSNMPEIAAFFWFLVLDIPLPIGAITILCIEIGTDVIPAISLAYEPAEYDLMSQPPRNQLKKRLFSNLAMAYSYADIGIIQMFAACYSYCVVMGESGFWIPRLITIRRQWDSRAINDLQDSYGQEWTFAQRKRLEYTCHTAYFAAIMACQVVNLILCRARKCSILRQGLFKNHHTSFAIIFAIALCGFLTYCPGLDRGLRMYPLRFGWWWPPLPFIFIMIAYAEIKKFLLRIASFKKMLGMEVEETPYM